MSASTAWLSSLQTGVLYLIEYRLVEISLTSPKVTPSDIKPQNNYSPGQKPPWKIQPKQFSQS